MMDMLPLKGSAQVIASGVTITSSYTAHTVISVDEQNFLGLLVKYTKGDETSLQLKVEVSVDGGTTYYQQTVDTPTGGAISVAAAERTYTGTGNYATSIQPIKVPATPTGSAKGLIKISSKATGGTPTGTLTLTATVGWV
jgi:hypothetical protein